MPLVDPSTALPLEALAAMRAGLLEELRGLPETLADAPGAGPASRARGETARQLVADAVAWAGSRPPGADRARLAAEINLLYDVTIVAAEYYKLFIRVPTSARPAGRI